MSLSLLNLSGCCEQVYSSMRNTVENLHSQLKLMGNFEPEGVTVTGKHGSNYRLSLSCNRKSKKLNLTNLFNSQQ